MEPLKKLPIFCDCCPTLAFAVLDGAPLCESCLLKRVSAHGAYDSKLNIEPLAFAPPRSFQFQTAQSFIQ